MVRAPLADAATGVYVGKKELAHWMGAHDLLLAALRQLDAKRLAAQPPATLGSNSQSAPSLQDASAAPAPTEATGQREENTAPQGPETPTDTAGASNTSNTGLARAESTDAYEGGEPASLLEELEELMRASLTGPKEVREEEEGGDDSCLCTHHRFDPICGGGEAV